MYAHARIELKYNTLIHTYRLIKLYYKSDSLPEFVILTGIYRYLNQPYNPRTSLPLRTYR